MNDKLYEDETWPPDTTTLVVNSDDIKNADVIIFHDIIKFCVTWGFSAFFSFPVSVQKIDFFNHFFIRKPEVYS